jgi:Rieske 2Fe-2S family protein
VWVGGDMELAEGAETMSLDGRSRGVVLRGLDERQRRRVVYVNLFPNLLLSLHPDYVLTHRLEPLAPDRTAIECQWLFPRERVERAGFDPGYAVDFWDITNRQDWTACESVQRGVSSRGYRPGPLSALEGAVHQFLCMVANAYLDGTVSAPRVRVTSV